MMKACILCVVFLCLIPLMSNADSFLFPDSDVVFYFVRTGPQIGHTDYSFGANTQVWLGKNVATLNNWTAHGILGWYRLTTHLMAATLDSIVCSLYVDAKDGSSYMYFYRTDSTKENAESNTVATTDPGCGTTWDQYEVTEGGGDPQCLNRSWTTGGGDFYSTKLDSFNVNATGWLTFIYDTASPLVDYLQDIIDGNHAVDKALRSGFLAQQGNLLITNDETDNEEAKIASDDDGGGNEPIFWFYFQPGEMRSVYVITDYMYEKLVTDFEWDGGIISEYGP